MELLLLGPGAVFKMHPPRIFLLALLVFLAFGWSFSGDVVEPTKLGGVQGTGVSKKELEQIRAHPYAGSKITRGKHEATAYGPPWNSMQGGPITSTGISLGPKIRRYVVAVDPQKNAYGTLLRIWPNPFRWRGPFVAADTGGAIKGRRIDFYDWRGRKSQYAWGRRDVRVWQYAP